MNLMSREYSSGSIKLLYSSPVSSVQIITGKFVSMVVFALIFVIILALPTIVMFYLRAACRYYTYLGRDCYPCFC